MHIHAYFFLPVHTEFVLIDIALERLYWVHVEYFPNHITVEVPLHVLDDIILVLSHGQIGKSIFDAERLRIWLTQPLKTE